MNVHEAIPGHHTQGQGKVEIFVDPGCTDGTQELAWHAFFGNNILSTPVTKNTENISELFAVVF